MSDDKNRRIEEWYCFLYLAKEDLMQARASLEGAGKPEHHDVSGSLVRDAVICYARPFNKCKGEKNTYELKVRWIPSEWRDLHREFMGVRKGFIAHTDLTVIKPRAARWHVADREALTPLVSGLIANTEAILREASSINDLIASITMNVIEEIVRIEKEPPFIGSTVRRQCKFPPIILLVAPRFIASSQTAHHIDRWQAEPIL